MEENKPAENLQTTEEVTAPQDPQTGAETTNVLFPEPCPDPTNFTVESCQDAARVTLSDPGLQSLGRIVQLDVTLRAICPGKRLAVSIILMELGDDGTEYPRGVKHILVPAGTGTECRDISLRCIPFSLPEALDTTGNTGSICNSRRFSARVIANYVDTDFVCCDGGTAVV